MTAHAGTLWLVATPIGNMGDMAPRAIEVLSSVALICCEDTRRTGKLLQLTGISGVKMAVANDHTEFHRVDEVLGLLGAGSDVAVVSDAGMPSISDPGMRLVQAAVEAGYSVSAVPGADAATTALVISGFDTGRWVFEGFLPRSGRERAARLAELASETRSAVVYEAPHRLVKTLADLTDACGSERQVAVCRELTKVYEEVVRGPLGSLDFGGREPRGEYVIVLDGAAQDHSPPDEAVIRAAIQSELDAGSSKRDAAAAVAARLGIPKKQAYALTVTPVL